MPGRRSLWRKSIFGEEMDDTGVCWFTRSGVLSVNPVDEGERA
jgi:hypothetical protein